MEKRKGWREEERKINEEAARKERKESLSMQRWEMELRQEVVRAGKQ